MNENDESKPTAVHYGYVLLTVLALILAGYDLFHHSANNYSSLTGNDSAKLDALQSQVSKLQTQLDDALKSTATESTDAINAQSTANKALAAAQAAQSGVDATNEKIDRLFAKSTTQ